MFRKLLAVLALIVTLTACTAAPEATPAAEPAAVVATEATDELWPAVDNQWAALVQCNYFIETGESRDDCTAAALETFPAIAACAEEDSAGPCYWNATARGNNAGESFTVDAAGTVTLLNPALR